MSPGGYIILKLELMFPVTLIIRWSASIVSGSKNNKVLLPPVDSRHLHKPEANASHSTWIQLSLLTWKTVAIEHHLTLDLYEWENYYTKVNQYARWYVLHLNIYSRSRGGVTNHSTWIGIG
jgi:hypothetical protein